MSCRQRHSRLESPLVVFLDYLTYDSDRWSHVFEIYSSKVGPNGRILIRLHVIKIGGKKNNNQFSQHNKFIVYRKYLLFPRDQT